MFLTIEALGHLGDGRDRAPRGRLALCGETGIGAPGLTVL